MPCFIHCADIHLDSPLRRLETYDGAPVEEIRNASRRALTNLVELAIEQAVDFVIIAGDLYDGDWRDQQTGLFFSNELSKLRAAGIAVYVIRGNHDAASVITKSLPLGNNPDGSPVLLSTSADTIRLEKLGITIHGQSFGQKAEVDNLAAGYPPPDRDAFNIGILHTSLSGTEGHDRYAPCTPTELVDKGYDYWALGHVHTRGEHQPGDTCPIVFPGNLQGRNPRETGPKGCVIVDVDVASRKTTRQFAPLDVVRWEVCQLDVTSVESADEILSLFLDWANDYAAEYSEGTLVTRVRLTGTSQLHAQWLRRHEYYETALRSASFEVAGPRLWIEGLRVRSELPRADDLVDLDGPLASVNEMFEKLLRETAPDAERRSKVSHEYDLFSHSQPNFLTGSSSQIDEFDPTLTKELEALNNKLPNGLLELDATQLLLDARASLLARLRGDQTAESE